MLFNGAAASDCLDPAAWRRPGFHAEHFPWNLPLLIFNRTSVCVPPDASKVPEPAGPGKRPTEGRASMLHDALASVYF